MIKASLTKKIPTKQLQPQTQNRGNIPNLHQGPLSLPDYKSVWRQRGDLDLLESSVKCLVYNTGRREKGTEGLSDSVWLRTEQFTAILVCKLCNIPMSGQSLVWVSLSSTKLSPSKLSPTANSFDNISSPFSYYLFFHTSFFFSPRTLSPLCFSCPVFVVSVG